MQPKQSVELRLSLIPGDIGVPLSRIIKLVGINVDSWRKLLPLKRLFVPDGLVSRLAGSRMIVRRTFSDGDSDFIAKPAGRMEKNLRRCRVGHVIVDPPVTWAPHARVLDPTTVIPEGMDGLASAGTDIGSLAGRRWSDKLSRTDSHTAEV